jgi:IclR family transcriptional regulator, acetate operon repressor
MLDRELADVRRRGWAASVDELEVGLAGVAAPVRAVDGAVLAAVSVSGPTARITALGVSALGDVLLAELRDLSKQLGNRGGTA